jgi:hypothetical protein
MSPLEQGMCEDLEIVLMLLIGLYVGKSKAEKLLVLETCCSSFLLLQN